MVPNDAKITAMADGKTPANLREDKFMMLAAQANANARLYTNPLDPLIWPELKDLNPAHGHFVDGKDFSSKWTKMKNQHDKLLFNLNQSGRNETGEILDCTAMQFCKVSGRVLNLPLLYCYLIWKNQDLQFASNMLPEAIALSTGLPGKTASSSSSTGAGKR